MSETLPKAPILQKLFGKKHKIRALIRDEAGRLHSPKLPYSNGFAFWKRRFRKTQTYFVKRLSTTEGKERDLFDMEGLPVFFYEENNPEPQAYLWHRADFKNSAEDLSDALDSRMLEQLLASSILKNFFWLIILVVFNLIISIVILLINTGVIKIAHAAATGGAAP